MTDEEKNEMENNVRSLQESYKLLSSEGLKQFREEPNDETMEEKVPYSLCYVAYCSIQSPACV